MPKKASLIINDSDYVVNLTFETHLYHQEIFNRYFRRLFVTIAGSIECDGLKEMVNTNCFIEQVRFR